MLNYKIKTLSNGLRVATAVLNHTKSVTILILTGVGSRHENDSEAGISHFLEHMFFKGTKKRPDYKKISEELDYLGGDFNAYTAEEYTGYYVQAAADRFLSALDILSDMFFNPLFPAAELQKEKGVIVEELNMYEDQPMSKVVEEAQKLVYGDSSLGRPIIGYKKTINAVNRRLLMKYHTDMYSPQNTIVAVAGAPLKPSWRRKLEVKFAEWRAKKPSLIGEEGSAFKRTEKQKESKKLVRRKTDQAHFCLAYRSFPITDSKHYQLAVLVNLLGGMKSSRLFEEVREKRGLAYYISAATDDHHDTGAVFIRGGVSVAKITDALEVVFRELDKVGTKTALKEEIKRSKENLKGRIYLGLEDSRSVASYLANRLLYHKKVVQPEEIIDKIDNVTPEQVRETAKYVFKRSSLKMAVVGPYKKEKF